MLIGLADDGSTQSLQVAEQLARMFGAAPGAVAPTEPTGSITWGGMTIRPAQTTVKIMPRPPGPTGSFLDSIFPKKLGTDGKTRIWGLPPSVAYAIALTMLGGAGLLVYRQVSPRTASNPKRRARRGARRGRRKR